MWKETVERRLPMKIAVVTDSGTGWTMEQARALGLYYLPLQVKCGDEEFLDGVDLTVSELYARLKRGEMPTTSMPPVGKVEALFNVSFEVGDDEIVSLIGANGAGKTTLMKTIVGINRTAQGSIEYNGRAIPINPFMMELCMCLRDGRYFLR